MHQDFPSPPTCLDLPRPNTFSERTCKAKPLFIVRCTGKPKLNKGRRSGVRPASWPLCRNGVPPPKSFGKAWGVICRRRTLWGQATSVGGGPPLRPFGAVCGVLLCRGCVDREDVDVAQERVVLPRLQKELGKSSHQRKISRNALSTHLATLEQESRIVRGNQKGMPTMLKASLKFSELCGTFEVPVLPSACVALPVPFWLK